MASHRLPDDLQQIEEAARRAWPAARHVHTFGWIVSISGGYTKRANSATLVYPEPRSACDRVIQRIEELYLHHGQPPIFRLVSFSTPDDVDQRLEARGYRAIDETLVMTAPLEPSMMAGVELQMLDTETGVMAHARMNGVGSNLLPAHKAILDRIPDGLSFCGIVADDSLVTCGCTVVHEEFAGLFDIVTDPAHRRKGHADCLVRGMLGRAWHAGARTAYLQVAVANAPAIALYRSLGFEPAYSYRYRILADS